MSVTISHNIDELELANLIEAGYEELKLFYSNGPEGPWTEATVTNSPATLADLEEAGVPYNTSMAYFDGNPALWFKVVPSGSGVGDAPLSDSDSFHGDGGTTLAYLRTRIGKQMRDMLVGTTTSLGTSTTAICTHANFTRYQNDHFNNWYFHNLATNQWALITDWVQSTGTFTLTPAIDIVAGDVSFEITRLWTPDEYRDAINWGIVNLYPILSKTYIDTSLRTQEAATEESYERIFQYIVPGAIRRIARVEIESDTAVYQYNESGHPWKEITFMPYYYNLTRGFEIKKALPDSRRLRVTGEGIHDLLYEDTDYVELVDPEINLLIYLSASNLWSLLPADAASSDIDRYERMAKYFLSLYGEFRDKFKVSRPSRKQWSPVSRWSTPNV